jgi:large subunit ribosomal protein L9
LKVLLIKDVKSLGRAGEIKVVKDGYGQNFLLAKGFAKVATDDVIKEWKEEQKEIEAKHKAELEQLENLSSRLSAITVVVKKELGANGHLYGAVTKDDIATALKDQEGIEIDKKSIEIKGNIKTSGKEEISVKLGLGIHGKFMLNVVGE